MQTFILAFAQRVHIKYTSGWIFEMLLCCIFSVAGRLRIKKYGPRIYWTKHKMDDIAIGK